MSSLIRSSAGVGIDVKPINAHLCRWLCSQAQFTSHNYSITISFFLHEHFINLLLYNLSTPSLKK